MKPSTRANCIASVFFLLVSCVPVDRHILVSGTLVAADNERQVASCEFVRFRTHTNDESDYPGRAIETEFELGLVVGATSSELAFVVRCQAGCLSDPLIAPIPKGTSTVLLGDIVVECPPSS